MNCDEDLTRTSLSPAPRVVGPWHAIALLLFVMGGVGIARCFSYAAHDIDFSHYYLTANILRSGGDPYSEPLQPLCEAEGVTYDERIPFGTHPPLIVSFFTLFSWLPLEKAYLVWAIGQAICTATVLFVMSRIVCVSRVCGANLAFAGLAFASTAMLAHWQYSQVQLLVGALLLTAYYAHSRQRHITACGLATTAACFKLFPIVLLPWFVLKGAQDRRAIALRLGAAAAVVEVTVAVTGVDAWYGFVTRGLPIIKSAGTSYSNFSFQAVVGRFVESWCAVVAPEWSELLPRLLVTGIAAAAFLAAYYGVWKRRWDDLVAFSLLVALMVLFSPVAWAHYMVLMILPVGVLLSRCSSFKSRWARIACAAAAIMCLMPNLDLMLLPQSDSAWRIAVHVYPTYCLFAAALFLVALPAHDGETVPNQATRSRLPVLPALPPAVPA